MKPRFSALSNRFANRNSLTIFVGCIAAYAFSASPVAHAANLYWDTNGTAAGFSTQVGTWDGTNAFFNPDPLGGSANGAAVSTVGSTNDLIIPSATTNTGTIAITGAQAASSITFTAATGAVTISGGTSLTLGGTGASSGIFSASTVGAETISTGLILNAANTAFNSSNSGSQLLTIGAITGAAASGTQTLTIGSGSSGNILLNGTIANVAGNASNVALTINNTGTGTTTLSALTSGFTGNISITGGTLIATGGNNAANTTTGPLGNPQTASRTMTVGTGTFLTFAGNDTLGNGGSAPVVKTIVNGGTINNNGNFFTTLGPVDLNGGTINSVGGASAAFPSFQLGGTVTVGGSAVSTISGSGSNPQMVLGIAGGTGTSTTFNVGDAVVGSASDLNVSAIFQNYTAVVSGLTKTGAGTMTLSGASTYTGPTAISAGTLSLSGTGSLTGTTITTSVTGILNEGATASINGTVIQGSTGTSILSGTVALSTTRNLVVNNGTVSFGGTLTATSTQSFGILVGDAANASGAMVQTGGSVTISGTDFSNTFNVGSATTTAGGLTGASGGFGSYTMTGGTINATRINVGGCDAPSGTTNSTNSVGLFTVLNGATAKFTAYFIGGRNVASNTGVATIAGGTLDLTTMANNTGAFGGGRFEINLGANLGGSNTGGSFNAGTKNINGVASVSTSQGIVNLLGGTLTTNAFSSPAGTATGVGINQFNFNGGTLKYGNTVTSATFFNAIAAGAAAGSGVFVRSGGAIIDDSGQAITIAANLVAPTGGEVTGITATGATGFLTAPYVKIVGGNGDATAVALIDGSGNLTSILVTNPGTGYGTAPTVTLVGGTTAGGTNITTGTATATVGASTTGGLTKQGIGTLTLSGTSTYTGASNVNAGKLTLGSGGNLGATAVAVNTSGTLGVTQTASTTTNAITGSIALNGGSGFTMADTFTSTLNVTGASTLAPASGTAPVLTFDIIGAAADKLAITGAATVGAGGAKISISPTNAVTVGTYTLITAASGLNTNFSLSSATLNNGVYTLTLGGSATTETVTVATAASALFWKGAGTSWNTAGNWTTDQGGTTLSGSAPVSTTDVAFSAVGAGSLTTNTLTAPLPVNSVNFLGGASSVTMVTSANQLTINGGGITNNSANAMTINNPITLGAIQSWVNNGAGLLTIGGAVVNGTNLLTVDGSGSTTIGGAIGTGAGGLTKSGTGTLTLSGNNANLTGNFIVNGGTLTSSVANGLGFGVTTRTVTINSGGIVNIGLAGMYGAHTATNNPTYIVNAGGTLTDSGANNAQITDITLNDGTLTSTGTGNGQYKSWNINGTVTSTGASTISGGTGGNLGITLASGTPTNTSIIVSSGTLTVTTAVADGVSAALAVRATDLTKTGTGTLALNGPNTYSGVTTISNGTVQLGNAAGLGTNVGATSIASGATLDLNGQTIAENFSATAGIGVGGLGALINNSATAAAITGTMATATQTFTVGGSGNITLPNLGSTAVITKVGSGTLTLSGTGDNGNGAVTVSANSGTVIFGKTSSASVHAIGNNSSVASGSTIQLGGSGNYQIWGAVILTVSSGGVLDVNGKNEDYSTMAATGGIITLSGTGISSGGALINSALGTTSTVTFGTGSAALQTGGASVGGVGNITIVGSTGISGAFPLTKVGTGTLTLSSANTYSGTTTISLGTLQVGGAGSLGSGAYAQTIANSATLQYSSSAAQTLSGAISGTGALTKDTSTTSTLTLSSTTNSYTGATTVSAGTLAVTGNGNTLGNTAIGATGTGIFAAKPGSGTVNLGSTATPSFGATLNLASGTTFTMVDAAVGTANLQQGTGFGTALTLAGATLNFDASAATADKLAVTSAATVTGTNNVNLTFVTAPTGGSTYTLITAASGLNTGGGSFVFGGSGTSTQTVAVGANTYLLTLVNSATAEQVTVGPATPFSTSGFVWTGRVNGLTVASTSWDTTVSTNNNWASGGTAINYVDGNAVTFQDTNPVAGGSTPSTTVVVQAGGVTPTSITFTNATLNYDVSGGAIGGTGALTKSGAGTVTLSGANTYNAGTTISSGTIIATSLGALGTGAVTDNGILNLSFPAGASSAYTGLSTSLAGNGTVNVTAAGLSTGSNSTILNGNYSSFTGIWNIGVGAASGAGKVQMNGLDNAAATINVLANATMYIAAAGTHNAAIFLNGGTTGEALGQLRLESGAIVAGNVTLAANTTIGANTGTGTISGQIVETGGSRALTKLGAGTTVLSNASNSYSGITTITGGTLSVGLLANGSSPSNIGQATNAVGNLVLNGGTLNYTGNSVSIDRGFTVSANSNVTIATSGQTLTTSGAVSATTQLGVNGPGILSLTGTVTLNSGGNSLAIFSGGTLTTSGAVTNTAGNMVFQGGTLNVTGGTFTANATTAMGNNSTPGSTLTVSGGTFNQAAGSFLLGQVAGSNPTINLNSGTFQTKVQFTGMAATASAFNFNGGTFKLGATLTNPFVTPANVTVTVNSGGAFIDLATFSTTISNNLLVGTGGGLTLNSTGGGGVLTLSGVNAYSGGTAFNGGGLTASTSNSALGSGTVTIGSTALQLVITDGLTIANNFTLNAATGTAGQGLIQNSSTGNATLSGGTITINAVPTNGGHFAGASTGTLTIADVINSSVAVRVRAGTVIFSSGGTYSAMEGFNGTIKLGATNGVSTSANLTLGRATGGSSFDLAGFNQSLAGLTKDPTAAATVGNSSTTADSLLTTTGTSDFAGVIQNTLGSGTRKVALTVTGGSLSLSGANTYTGATTVGLGQLTLGTGGSLGGTDVSVGSGATPTASAGNATLLVKGDYTIGASATGTLTVKGGNTGGTPLGQGTLSLVDGTTNTLTLSSSSTGTVLTLGNATAANPSVMNFDVGAVADRVTITTGALSTLGVVTVNMNIIGALSIIPQQTLISAGTASGTNFNVDSTHFVLGTTTGNTAGYSFTLTSDATHLYLNEVAIQAPVAAYWKGSIDGNWNSFSGTGTTNFVDGPTGAATTQVPGAASNVFFTATTAGNLSTTLGQNFAINSLNFTGTGTSAASPVTISGSTLTLNATTANGNTMANGINILAGNGTVGISSNVVLGISQSWTNNSASLLTVNGTSVTGTGNSLTVDGSGSTAIAAAIQTGVGTLIKTGAGQLTLSGGNNYSGGTTLTGGIIEVNSSTALGGGTLTFNGGVSLSVASGLSIANAIVIGTNTGAANSALLLNSGASSTTLSGPITINNAAAAGGHFGSSGAGVLNLTGVITSSVGVTQEVGIVSYSGGGTGYTSLGVSGTARLGASNGLSTSATVSLGTNLAGVLDLAGFNQSLAGITKSGAAATVGNSSGSLDSTLTTTGTSIYAGTIVNALGAGNRKVNLNVNGGALTLSGANTYTGTTAATAGTLTLQNGSASATTATLDNTATTVSAGATLSVSAAGSNVGTSNTVTAGNTATTAAGASIALNAGASASNLTMADSLIGTFNVLAGATFAGPSLTVGSVSGATAPVLTFDLNATQTDVLNLTKDVLVGATGGKFAFNILPGTTSLASSYTFINASGGLNDALLTQVTSTYNVGGHTYTGSLASSTSTAEVVTFTQTSTLANAFWGSGSGLSAATASWNSFTAGVTNWSTAQGAFTEAGVLPASNTNVNFSVTGTTTFSTTLGENFAIESLTFLSSNTAATSIAGNTLTLQATGQSGNTAGNGINIQAGAGTVNVSSNIVLGANQTWTNSSSSLLAVGGVSGTNKNLTVASSTGGVAIGGAITTGTGSLTATGAGTLTLSGANTYTGITTVTGGTLSTGTAGSLANGGSASSIGQATNVAANLVLDGGTLLYASTGAAQSTDRLFTLTNNGGTLVASGTNAITFAGNGAGAANAIAYTGTATRTLALTGTGAGTLAPILADNTGATSLTKSGTGTWTLTNANTYSGDTAINAGTLALSGAGSIVNSPNITLASGATFDVSTLTTALTLGATQALKVSATGINTTATVTTLSTKDLTLSAGGLTFTTYSGGNNNANPPLTVTGTTAGELKLNGAPITVTTTTSLQPGDYVLVGKAGNALVTGTPGTLTINGSGASNTASLAVTAGQLVLTVNSGPGPVDHFVISAISSPQTIGTPITGITLTAQDVANATATSFTGTVTFSGTGGFTGTSATFTAGVLSGVSVTPTVSGSSRTLIVTDGASHTGTATFNVQTRYDEWGNRTFTNAFTDKDPTHNPDFDALTNLQEYAFGTDPTVSTTGSIVWVNGGAVTNTGLPVAFDFSTGMGGVDYRAVFGRRKDYVAAGLTYTVQFSADMIQWQNSTATPTLLTSPDNTVNTSEIDAMSVPYPLFVPLSGGGFGKPTFLRVGVQ